jgi:hypothetical protein
MIKWLWKLIVGHGCWGHSCRWETVKDGTRSVPDGEGGKRVNGMWCIQRCTVCGIERGGILVE